MKAYQPLPIARVSYGRPGYQDFAFDLPDAEGMPGPRGRRHAAVDWFAAGGEPIKAPRAGRVVEANPSRGNTGQVFGGTVKVAEPSGAVWVARHIDPAVSVGQAITAAQVIARVTAWRGGPSHLHLEIWRSLTGGYNVANAIDPESVEFTLLYGERPPPPHGNTLRLAIGDRGWAGWEDAAGAVAWVAREGLRPRVRAALAFDGTVWRGAKPVTAKCRDLNRRYLMEA